MASQLRAQGRGVIGLGAGDTGIIKEMKKIQPQKYLQSGLCFTGASLAVVNGDQGLQQSPRP